MNISNDGAVAVSEMKELVRQKLCFLAQCMENNRTQNLTTDLEVAISMMVQLSQFTDIEESLNCAEQALELVSLVRNINYEIPQPEVEYGFLGRPAFYIPSQTLEFFIQNGFKVKEMADMLGVSKRTVERRLSQLNLKVRQTYSPLCDEDLDKEVQKLTMQFPFVGYRTISAMLLSMGHRVQEYRIRQAMLNVDPQGVLFRRLFITTCRIQRRTYNVSGPQCLWHIDGNHKLVRWRFIIHGGIDGYSRLPVYLKVSNNNNAQTVLSAFMEAVQKYGLPKRVRSDKGGENTLVAEYMLHQRDSISRPFIAGRSVHNQRIERLWRELWSGCTATYYQLFFHMEDLGILEIENELHLQVLHLVYLRRIQTHLGQFCEALKRRPLRTENNRSPMQLWILGQAQNPSWEPQNEADLQSYGIDYEGPAAVTCGSVQVPDTLPLSDVMISEIQHILGQESNCFGLDLYEQILNILQ